MSAGCRMKPLYRLGRQSVAPLIVAAILLIGNGAGAVMRDAECDDLDVSLEPAADFRTIKCETGQEAGGGDRGSLGLATIEAEDALSFFIIYHDRAGTRTYLSRRDPEDLFADHMDFAVEGTWSDTSESNGFDIAKFFGKFDFASEQVPCFAFSRFAGHVEHSTGYRHMVGGFYCEFVPSDQPVTDARVDQMTGKIKADMF
jgi:hypothetical protein